MDAVPAAVSTPPRRPPLAARRAEREGPVQPRVCPAPETLHPALWLGHQLGRSAARTVASGFAALDAELPDGGWPRRSLAELLLPHPGVGEIRLLAPALVAAQRAGRLVMFFDPPAALAAAALAGLGFEVEDLLIIQTRARRIEAPTLASLAAAQGGASWLGAARRPDGPGSDSLWALEQALKSGHVGAV